jgi:DNA-binding MarR family transcriptional regulator
MYILQHPAGDLHRFALWLVDQLDPAPGMKTIEGADPRLKSGRPITEEFAHEEEFLANFYLGRMTRYLKFYLKPILQEHGFASPDEFNLLAMIEQMDEPTKKELCTATVTELTTGQAIIRRLIERDLVLERVDERDARAKRLTITEKGATLLQQVYSQLQGLEPKALADLPDSDRQQFLRSLKYLNNYHFQAYANGLSET